MPIYDLICPGCKQTKKDVFQKMSEEMPLCTTCGTKMERKPTAVVPSTFPAEGIFFEHVSPKGERFHSKQEIKDYAKANNIEFDYLS